jgi:hypothetical protein
MASNEGSIEATDRLGKSQFQCLRWYSFLMSLIAGKWIWNSAIRQMQRSRSCSFFMGFRAFWATFWATNALLQGWPDWTQNKKVITCKGNFQTHWRSGLTSFYELARHYREKDTQIAKGGDEIVSVVYSAESKQNFEKRQRNRNSRKLPVPMGTLRKCRWAIRICIEERTQNWCHSFLCWSEMKIAMKPQKLKCHNKVHFGKFVLVRV